MHIVSGSLCFLTVSSVFGNDVFAFVLVGFDCSLINPGHAIQDPFLFRLTVHGEW